jgi:flavin reductase (DIM6/NTAB) family NADH-FMN oxidoreductase RutF
MATPKAFTDFVTALDYPMFVVTVAARGERDGCLVGFATQCSIHPARFVVCLSDKNRTYRLARDAAVLAVHLLADDEKGLAELFGGQTGDEVDKLARWPWRPGPEGVPILEGPPDWFVGRILERVDFGDHVGFLLDPVEAGHDRDEPGLGFQATRDIDPGHAP